MTNSFFSDLTKKSNSDRSSFSSHAENNIPSTIRKGGLYESEGSDPTTTPNSGSLKRFKSNRDESNEIITMTSSLDSLHDAAKSDTSDDGKKTTTKHLKLGWHYCISSSSSGGGGGSSNNNNFDV